MNKTVLLRMCSLVIFLMLSGSLALEAQSQKGSAPPSDKAQKGAELYNDYCYRCHDNDPRSKMQGIMGPKLTGLFKKDKLMDGKPVKEANVKEFIKVGPTPQMPGFRYSLSDEEIGNIVEFLKTR